MPPTHIAEPKQARFPRRGTLPWSIVDGPLDISNHTPESSCRQHERPNEISPQPSLDDGSFEVIVPSFVAKPSRSEIQPRFSKSESFSVVLPPFSKAPRRMDIIKEGSAGGTRDPPPPPKTREFEIGTSRTKRSGRNFGPKSQDSSFHLMVPPYIRRPKSFLLHQESEWKMSTLSLGADNGVLASTLCDATVDFDEAEDWYDNFE